MPTYRFTGGYPRVLTGLSEGPAAHHDGTPPGATIEAAPGDLIRTDAPYPHPELTEVPDGEAPAGAVVPGVIPASPEQSGGVNPGTPAEGIPVHAGEVILTADEVAHLTPETLAAIHQAEQAADPATHQE